MKHSVVCKKHFKENLEDADDAGEHLPHGFMYKMLLSGVLEEYYEIDLKIAGCMPQQKKTYQLSVGVEIVLECFFASMSLKEI
jgi:hypothetical protein